MVVGGGACGRVWWGEHGGDKRGEQPRGVGSRWAGGGGPGASSGYWVGCQGHEGKGNGGKLGEGGHDEGVE